MTLNPDKTLAISSPEPGRDAQTFEFATTGHKTRRVGAKIDPSFAVARKYGALAERASLTNRNLFVVGPDGRIAYRATPFREVDPTAYTELGAAIDKLVPAPGE